MAEIGGTMYDFESSARPTNTGMIDMTKRETAKKTVKKVIKMPSTSGIFHLRSFTTNGQSRSAKKHEIKNKNSTNGSLKIMH